MCGYSRYIEYHFSYECRKSFVQLEIENDQQKETCEKEITQYLK